MPRKDTAIILATIAAWLSNSPHIPPAAQPDCSPRSIERARRHNAHKRRRK